MKQSQSYIFDILTSDKYTRTGMKIMESMSQTGQKSENNLDVLINIH